MGKKKRHAEVPFEKIIVDEGFNSRQDYNNIEELAESIQQHSLLQDLGGTYATNGEDVHLVYGFRRYKAIEWIRENVNPEAFNTVPFVITDAKPNDLKLRNLAENIDREQLSPAEIAEHIDKLVKVGLDQRTIGAQLGRPQSWVSYHYKVAQKLGTKAWAAFENKELTLEQALYVADVPEKKQASVVEQILEADTRVEKKRIAKQASKEEGKRRTYKTTRPNRKAVSVFVDNVSKKAAGEDATTTAFYNGMAAALRVVLGDKDMAKVDPEDLFLDEDFTGRRKAETEKTSRKQKAADKKNAAKQKGLGKA